MGPTHLSVHEDVPALPQCNQPKYIEGVLGHLDNNVRTAIRSCNRGGLNGEETEGKKPNVANLSPVS